MPRLFPSLAMVLLGCLAVPAGLDAQNASFYNQRGLQENHNHEYDKAIADFNQVLRLLDPNNAADAAIVYCNRGIAWDGKGEYDKAVADFNEAIRLNPNDAEARWTRGNTWFHESEYDKAIGDYSDAIRLKPDYADAYNNRGTARDYKDEYDKAIADYSEAIRLRPSYADAYNNRGSVWKEKSEYDKAIADFDQALRLDPNAKNAYRNRGKAWCSKGEYEKAIADYNQAFAANANDANLYNAAARLRATCPDARYRDGKRAVENATKAYQLTGGKNWAYVDTLAAAYAESGDFVKARQWAVKAVETAVTDKSATDGDKAALRSRLELYQQGRPYREGPK